MILAKETTVWKDTAVKPNHVYLMNDSMSKVYAYFKWGNKTLFEKLKTPLTIDKRYRTFKILQRNIKDMV